MRDASERPPAVLRQVSTLARHEFVSHLRAFRVRLLTAVTIAMAPVAVLIGLEEYQVRSADHERLVAQYLADRQEDAKVVTGVSVDPALRAIRPPSSLSILVRGLDDELPLYWDVSGAGTTAGRAGKEVASVQGASLSLDLEFLVRTVLGFLALVLGSEAVAVARDRGTLKVLLSQPLSAGAIAIAKLLGGALVLLLAVVAVWSAALTVVWATTPAVVTSDLLLTSFVLAAGCTLYLVVLFGVGMAVGAVSRSSYSANVSAGIVWLVMSFVSIPMLAFAARATAPVPGRSAFEAVRDGRYAELARAVEEDLGMRFRTLMGPRGDSRSVTIESPVASEIETLWLQRVSAASRTVRDLTAEASSSWIKRQRTSRRLAYLNPAALLLEASSDLAGTGSRSVRRMWDSVETYQHAMEEALFLNRPRITLRVPSDRGTTLEVITRHALPKVGDLPRFVEPRVGWIERLTDAVDLLAALAVYAVAVGVLVWRSCRYRPANERGRRSE
jgi:ABC-type transport system involved in multi-copper enzyme maturation permease subunit